MHAGSSGTPTWWSEVLNQEIRVPDPEGYGIASVGAGAIVCAGHLPAYQKGCLRVEGVFDKDREAAVRAARDFGIRKVYKSFDDVLRDPEVDIVDIAVPAEAQYALAMAVIASGRHLLCQKPLSHRLEQAAAIVRAAKKAGVRIAVNQQMRWAPIIAAIRTLLDRGVLGDLRYLTIELNIATNFAQWPWLLPKPRNIVTYNTIHFIDAVRFLTGAEPRRLYARTSRQPGQVTVGETEVEILYDGLYPTVSSSESCAVPVRISDRHNNRAGDVRAVIRVEGTAGVAQGLFGTWHDYPHGRDDEIEIYVGNEERPFWLRGSFRRRWIPDAFLGPMAGLIGAVKSDSEPPTSGRDNLRTLGLVEAVYASAERGAPVSTEEMIMKG